MSLKAVHVVVRGRVQGVGYRAWTRNQADLRSLRGWVRNRPDGTVEAVLAGPPEAVDLMLKAMASGPMFARVDGLDVTEADPAGAGQGAFEQRETG